MVPTNKMATPEATKAGKDKETASLLMSIIRTITTSEDVVSREREKAKLEKEYKDSDKKLDRLVTEHQTDLTSIIQAFSKISKNITESQEKIRAIKDNLQSCKNLLHCKRGELRQLWIDGIEHRTTVEMLDQIEEVSNVSDKLQSFIDKKHYLHATDLLIKSVSLLEGDLKDVDSLRDVRMELLSKKEELYEKLVEELHRQIYIKPMSSVVKGFQRQGSLRASKGKNDKDKYLRMALMNSAKGDRTVLTEAEQNLQKMMEVKLEEISQAHTIVEDVHVTEPDADPVHFITILVQSLAILMKMPEAIDTLRSQIRPGLLAIVLRASQQVSDNAYSEGDNLASMYQPQLLLELLQLVFQQFRVVARIHQIVIANMQRIKVSVPHMGGICIYDTVEVWVKVQAVLQLFLSDYLDIRNTASSQSEGHSNFDEQAIDVAQHFSKKRPGGGKVKKFALFRFDASSHAISMNSYLREQRQEFYGSGEILSGTDNISDVSKAEFVCKPCSTNITVIYNPLQNFVREIENQTLAAPGSLPLQKFVTQFIRDNYLQQVQYNISMNIDQATKGFDAQRFLVDLRTQRELGVKKPLLQSTVSVARSLHELQALMRSLPDYADQFLHLICRILGDYRETCQAAYRSLVMPEGDDKRIISANWAKDEDIGRFIRSLPSWSHLKEENPEVDEDDLRAMNSKESSILTSNLSSSEALIPQQEIVSDTMQLMTLGNMVESLEWFSEQILELVRNLEAQNQNQLTLPSLSAAATVEDQTPKLPTISDNTLMTLRSLSGDFTALSELCLLVLHLEVRVHCFYHLLPIAKQSNYSGAIDDMDPDSHVIRLNKDLSAIEAKMTESVQPPKFRYIFEGLGHLVASILINSTQYLKRINENGIKKMCRNIFAIQHCLTNITANRESDLDHAKQYYELLYLTPDIPFLFLPANLDSSKCDPVKRKRGRPKKLAVETETDTKPKSPLTDKRRRGRPSKLDAAEKEGEIAGRTYKHVSKTKIITSDEVAVKPARKKSSGNKKSSTSTVDEIPVKKIKGAPKSAKVKSSSNSKKRSSTSADDEVPLKKSKGSKKSAKVKCSTTVEEIPVRKSSSKSTKIKSISKSTKGKSKLKIPEEYSTPKKENLCGSFDCEVSTPGLELQQSFTMEIQSSSPDDKHCVICMSDIDGKKKTLEKCLHSFCADCIKQWFEKTNPICPSCGMVYGPIVGNMPKGTMSHKRAYIELPGYEGDGCIEVHYDFPSGKQTAKHPHPGQSYSGTYRVAYLPNNTEGQKVLRLLRLAFDRKLTFTVGRSVTTGCDNTVVWNDIHHKTNVMGGSTGFGYPDPTYLNRVQQELASKGVVE